jgi:hypothetical protein
MGLSFVVSCLASIGIFVKWHCDMDSRDVDQFFKEVGEYWNEIKKHIKSWLDRAPWNTATDEEDESDG